MPAVEHSKSNKTLHIKIAFSFVFFMFVIVSMAGIVIIERKRLVEIEKIHQMLAKLIGIFIMHTNI